ncbi:hypothetical protein IQ255_16345 [Pleurocapsales cyanobacterium LEGE 10410]|nr:hypothetical protein [Pleurocapsales cyanobacterium LEGE 10410]
MKTIKVCLLLIFISCLVGCGQNSADNSLSSDRHSYTIFSDKSASNLAEVAPPTIIKELNQDLEQYNPQVKIISPQAEDTLDRTDISVQLSVEDLPIFQDDKLKLGNHLNLILDNEPYQQIYSLDQPIILKNITPGTHTIRVFAVRPWGESFKNEGAYAQSTFNVLTETNDNRPETSLPLLTYNNPTGTYGAEPLMLDFYLTNAPLHAIAQNDLSLKDWRVKATVNGVSFLLKNWQPIYLTGFEQGENWIQLELIDEAGNSWENTFNNTVRVITYDPQTEDALAKLVSNKISLADARTITKQYYVQPSATEVVELDNSSEPTIASEESVKTVEPQVKKILEDSSASQASEPDTITTIDGNSSEMAANADTPAEIDNSDRSEQTIAVVPIKEQIESQATKQQTNNSNLETTPNVATETEAETEQSAKPIPITGKDFNNQDSLTTIEIAQPDLAKITEAEQSVTLPETESSNSSQPKPQNPAPLWWKKILVSLRQKIEGLARLLPDRV